GGSSLRYSCRRTLRTESRAGAGRLRPLRPRAASAGSYDAYVSPGREAVSGGIGTRTAYPVHGSDGITIHRMMYTHKLMPPKNISRNIRMRTTATSIPK